MYFYLRDSNGFKLIGFLPFYFRQECESLILYIEEGYSGIENRGCEKIHVYRNILIRRYKTMEADR